MEGYWYFKIMSWEFKKNKFEKSRKLKTKRRTVKNIVRHQLTNVDDKIKDIFITKRTKEEWWDKILTEEKTHLVTKDELKDEYYLFTDIPEDGGYFINGTTGYLYSDKEKLLLKHINKTKILWKRSNDPLMLWNIFIICIFFRWVINMQQNG